MRYKYLVIVGIILLVISNNYVAASEIGYVDYEFLFTAHPEYSAKNLEFQTTVEQLKISFNQDYMTMAEEDLDNLLELYEDKIDQLHEKFKNTILESIDKAISQVAKAKNISIVVTESIVLYGGVDLSQLVLEEIYGYYGISVPSYLRIRD